MAAPVIHVNNMFELAGHWMSSTSHPAPRWIRGLRYIRLSGSRRGLGDRHAEVDRTRFLAGVMAALLQAAAQRADGAFVEWARGHVGPLEVVGTHRARHGDARELSVHDEWFGHLVGACDVVAALGEVGEQRGGHDGDA